ncbi:MAG: hypothetical protein LQ340_002103 [Diploschistes diacapsis]|nr:MAG: hypothetical protein LQ340_002103 [Diploschistes diacapsis]
MAEKYPSGIAGRSSSLNPPSTYDQDALGVGTSSSRSHNRDMEPSGHDRRPAPANENPTYSTTGAPTSGAVAEDLSQTSSRQEEPRSNVPLRANKPPMSRRSSSAYQGPRRGQEFSADDDANEYESDALHRASTNGRTASGFVPTLRRQSSNLRRRGQTMQQPTLHLPRLDSRDEDESEEAQEPKSAPHQKISALEEETNQTSGEDIVQGEGDADDDDDLSDAESFTLRDRQHAINETHPFGIRIWKPALYKKNRSVEKSAEGDIHSSPGGRVSRWLWLFNLLWTVVFGWWLALIAAGGGVLCYAFGFLPDTAAYGRVLLNLAAYFFYPFGKFVRLEQDEAYAQEDEGEGRSITEYEQWQSGDLEDGRLFFGPLATPSTIVGRQRAASMDSADENDSLLGHSRSGGPHGSETNGTNIFLINLIGVVLFAIFDYYVFGEALKLDTWLVHPGFIFCLSLFSSIPLAYFIGQAVASISAQSSMGLAAAINAFFSTVVEVFLYCVALKEGKGQLVEGSIIGSIFAGILFLPGLSMCFGATKRKTQRFNVRSAGVTSTMLLFAVIAAFGPTLFYQIYGSACLAQILSADVATSHKFLQLTTDSFYLIGLWFTLRTHAAVIWNEAPEEKKPLLQNQPNGNPQTPHHAIRKPSATNVGTGSSAIRDTKLYKRILGQSLKQVGLDSAQGIGDTQVAAAAAEIHAPTNNNIPHLVPPKSTKPGDASSFVDGLSSEQNEQLVRQVAEMAATAATVAARDAYRSPRMVQNTISATTPHSARKLSRPPTIIGDDNVLGDHDAHAGGGHDAPNWSRKKSTFILLGATVLYAIIAEILVNTVDVVLENIDIDEKFLGITLFALVPNTTEFLNAISFAMNGNIALSMEIGSAYALQVCLLQIPALVLYSAVYGRYIDPTELINHTFNLIFPQWDMVTVILCVFLLSYVYGEGKSNYFKGSILCLAYFVIVLGFYLSGFSNQMEANGINRFEIMSGVGPETFKTIGRRTSGQAF